MSSEVSEALRQLVAERAYPERVAFRKMLAESGRYPTVEALALLRGGADE